MSFPTLIFLLEVLPTQTSALSLFLLPILILSTFNFQSQPPLSFQIHIFFDISTWMAHGHLRHPGVPPHSIPVLLLVFTISGCDITSHPTAQIQNLQVIPDRSSKPHPLLVLAGSPSSIPPRSHLSCHQLCRLTEEASVLSPTKMGSPAILLFKFLL